MPRNRHAHTCQTSRYLYLFIGVSVLTAPNSLPATISVPILRPKGLGHLSYFPPAPLLRTYLFSLLVHSVLPSALPKQCCALLKLPTYKESSYRDCSGYFSRESVLRIFHKLNLLLQLVSVTRRTPHARTGRSRAPLSLPPRQHPQHRESNAACPRSITDYVSCASPSKFSAAFCFFVLAKSRCRFESQAQSVAVTPGLVGDGVDGWTLSFLGRP